MFLLEYYQYEVIQYLLILVPILLALVAQSAVNSAYKKGSMVQITNNKCASEVAYEMLLANGISDVIIQKCNGHLTDHYNPKTKTLNLSKSVYVGKDAASLAIAAHEVGHAVQHAEGYSMLKLRNSMVGITNFANNVSWVLIFVGLLLGSLNLIIVGLFLFSIVALFQLITLPVELNASKRGYKYLTENYVIVADEEKKSAKSVLSCAAFTYVVALLTSIAQILRFIVMIFGRRSRN